MKVTKKMMCKVYFNALFLATLFGDQVMFVSKIKNSSNSDEEKQFLCWKDL